MRNRMIISLLLLLLPILGDGQSLSELLGIAQDQNLELKALNQEYLAVLEKAPQVRQLPDPEVGIGAFVSPVETRLGAQQFRLGVSQMFPWFGTLAAKEQVVLAQAKVELERISIRNLELKYLVKVAYFQCYEKEKAKNIIRQNIRILNALRQLSLSRIESGKGSAVDVLQVDLNIQEMEQELLVLDRQLEQPLAELNQILNRPLKTPLQLQDSLSFALLPYHPDTLLTHMREHHPMLSMFEQQQETARKIINLNALEAKPSFGLGADYIQVNSRSDANPIRNGSDIAQISAKVRIPLFQEKYRAKEREENLKITALEYRKSDIETQFLSKIEKAFSDYKIADLRQDLYTRQVLTTKSAIRILQANYSTAGTGFDDLLRLEKTLLDYDLKMLKAIVQSQIAQATIERYLNF